MKKLHVQLLLAAAFLLLLSACSGTAEVSNPDVLDASGNISIDDLGVASEISGKVLSVEVNEGDDVEAGDVLFRLDDEILQAQYDQAAAAVDVAQAAVDAATAQVDSAKLQAEIASQAARVANMQNRTASWQTQQPGEITLPGAKHIFQVILGNVGNDDFLAAEERLGKAQTAFMMASQVLAQASQAQDNTDLRDAAQKDYDSALAELDAAQLEYDRQLTGNDANDVLETRAEVALAQARLDNAQDALVGYQTGDDALQVQAAQAGVKQAETALAQAQAGLAQAKAALKVLEISLDKVEVKSPISGVVLSENLIEGQLVASGASVMTIGQLDEVTLTVYIPEDQYGQVSLGQDAIVRVDSFPDRTFSGTVTYIADQAEFTPRNVQTTEGRTNTVFAVKVTIPNPDW
ncbi:MAG: efflux RND transporter periplasmic adaptor subunit, partial [Anaerolineales bacterium]